MFAGKLPCHGAPPLVPLAPAIGSRRPYGSAVKPQPNSERSRERTQTRLVVFSGLLLTWAVAWAPPAGLIVPDTKNDLYVSPARFLARSLHLWDPQSTWGVMQNQAYGYLFPMGPFFALGAEILPVWVVQRLWWMLLLSVGLGAMLWLLRELGIRSSWVMTIGALSYVLSARVVTTISGLSSEALPALLAPLILAPLVRCSNGLIGPRRAAAISGCALLATGGVNATATAWAAVPAALWLLTRAQWWRQPLTWWWGGSVLLASAWWLGPLLLLGRFSPPFLDWIESASVVAAPIELLDVVRGTSHWLGHLVLPAGPWWPAGHDLVSSPALVLATTFIAGLGLASLSRRGMPHRRFLLLTVVLGLIVMSISLTGPLASPASESAQRLLDGPLAPLRNFHKADLLVRLPLSISLAFGLERLANVKDPQRLARVARTAPWLAAAAIVAVASPGFVGRAAPPGAFPGMASQWEEVAAWVDARGTAGRSLIVPASTFAEYTWGRPIDEPLRALADAPFAVRDGVPLTPANTIRFLDAIERRLQSGRDSDGLAAALGRAGVQYLILRNDLDTRWTGGVSPVHARSALLSTPDLKRVASFGRAQPNEVGDVVAPVEVFEVTRDISPEVQIFDVDALVGASGSSDALLQLADAGITTPVIFDGDNTDAVDLTRRVETDAYQARGRAFGSTRGRDFTDLVSADEDIALRDYRPWADPTLRANRTYVGLSAVTASSSIAREQSLAELRPEHGVAAAVDGDGSTSWLAYGDPQPTIRIQLSEPTNLSRVEIRLVPESSLTRSGVAAPTRIRVTSDAGEVDHDLDPGLGHVSVDLPPGPTSQVSVAIVDTRAGPPEGTLTGLAGITLLSVEALPTVVLPRPETSESSDAILLGSWEGTQDGCVATSFGALRCLADGARRSDESSGLNRLIAVTRSGEFSVEGTLERDSTADRGSASIAGASLHVSSLRPSATSARSLIDADSRTAWSPNSDDRTPRIVVEFDMAQPIEEIRLVTRDGWAARYRPFVEIAVDETVHVARLSRDGSITIPRSEGSRFELRLLLDTGDPNALPSLEVERLLIPALGEESSLPVVASCGEGPSLVVGGSSVPTRVVGVADSRLGLQPVRFESCSAIDLPSHTAQLVILERWRDFRPQSMTLTRLGTPPIVATSSAVTFSRETPTRIEAEIPSGERARIVVLDENSNDAWVARLDGQPLTEQVVDGFRQGFIIGPGLSGSLVIDFEADGPYRTALLLGSALSLLCLLGALWPGDRERRVIPPAARMRPAWARLASVLVIAGLISGAAGLAIAAVLGSVVAASHGWRRIPGLLPGAVLFLVLMAGGVQAWEETTGGGGHWVDVVTWVLCLAAVSLVVLGAPPRTSRASRSRSS